MAVATAKVGIDSIIENCDETALLGFILDRVSVVDGIDSCWEWKGYHKSGRYPAVCINKKGYRGKGYVRSLIADIILKSDLNPSRVITATCDNFSCVNPDHLTVSVPLNGELRVHMEFQDKEAFLTALEKGTITHADPKWEGSPCWLAELTREDGYVQYNSRNKDGIRKKTTLHRVVAEFIHGESVEGVPVHHKCANRACVNPDHLQITTHQENTAEMLARSFYETRISEAEAIMRDLLNTLPEGIQRDKVEAYLLAS